MNAFSIAPEQIDEYWPRVRHHFERLERKSGLVLASAIREDLKLGHKHLWIATNYEGVAVTEVSNTPKGLGCTIYAAAGTESHKGQIDEIIGTIEAWARNIGCTRLMLQGRKGWTRRLRGFRQTGVVLEKEF